MRQAFRTLAFLAVPLLAPGCGSSDTVRVDVKLLKGGAAYTPPEGQRIGVTLYAMQVTEGSGKTVPVGEPFQAVRNPAEATFSVPGPDGRGIPPGKYRVAVTQKMTREAFEAAKLPLKKAVTRETDMLADRFAPESSPIIREIKGPQELLIDIDRPAD
jgi:hypothetical protein